MTFTTTITFDAAAAASVNVVEWQKQLAYEDDVDDELEDALSKVPDLAERCAVRGA